MRATEEILAALHGAVGDSLLSKINSGEATAAEFAQAIKFLKDNGIESIATGDSALAALEGSLKQRLPFSDSTNPAAH